MAIRTERRLFAAIAGFSVLCIVGILWAAATATDCDVAMVIKVPYCTSCKKILDTEDIVNNKHKTCEKKPDKTDACVKSFYQCPSCKISSNTPGRCETCKKGYAQKPSYARVVYRCPKCRTADQQSGACGKAECKGTKRVKSCEMSGTPPHVGPGGR